MGNVKWIKLNVDMFDDEKIKIVQSMPEGDAMLVVWIKLITLAGKTNDGGYIYIAENMPYTDEMLAVIMNKPLNTIRLAVDTFIKLGMIETDTKGIYLINFEKHQSLDKLEKLKEQNRKRVADHRAKKKQLALGNECNVTSNVTVTQSNAIEEDIDIDIEIDKEKKKKDIKHKYGEYKHVLLTDKEYSSLESEYGSNLNDIIKYLDEYLEMKGTKYKSHYLVIRKWGAKAAMEQRSKENINFFKRFLEA